MFPSQEVKIENVIETDVVKHGKTFGFDFNLGDFIVNDGKVVVLDGIEALKMWITKVLKTEKFRFKIYNTENNEKYGISLLELINSDYPISFIEAEIQREITDTLLTNLEIKAINNFVFNKSVKRTLNVSFNCMTIYGKVESEVIR